MKLLLAPLAAGLAVLEKVWDVVAGTPNIPPQPAVVLDSVGPWAGWEDTL